MTTFFRIPMADPMMKDQNPWTIENPERRESKNNAVANVIRKMSTVILSHFWLVNQSNFLEYKSSNVDKGRRKYGSSQSIFVDFFVTMSSSISCICCIGFFSSSYCRTNMPIIGQTHSPYISMAPTPENIIQIFCVSTL